MTSEEKPHIRPNQRLILEELKKNKAYMSVADIMKALDKARPTIQDHLQLLVGYRCVHKRPGPGFSFEYRWLRDEPDMKAELMSQEHSSRGTDKIDPDTIRVFLEAFSSREFIPIRSTKKFLPQAVAIIINELNSITYGDTANKKNLQEARTYLKAVYKALDEFVSTVHSLLITEELFDPDLLGSYLEELTDSIPFEEMTSVVDRIRAYNE